MMHCLQFRVLHLPPHFHIFPSVLKIDLSSLFSCSSAGSQIYFYSSKPSSVKRNPVIFNYLVETLNFSKASAVAVSERLAKVKSTAKPKKTVHLLQTLGFSNAHIQSSVRTAPWLLTTNTEKTLKPKLMFFQELGFDSGNLPDFISKKPNILMHSLEKKLKPCVMVIKEILEKGNDDIKNDLIMVLSKRCWVIPSVPWFLSGKSRLESYGIVGSQLSTVLKRHPRIFIMHEEKLNKRLSEISKMGLQIGSTSFLNCMMVRCTMADESFNKRHELFQSFGFSGEEFLQLFKKLPNIMTLSDERLRSALEFFLLFLNLDKSVLVNRPLYLSLSLTKRVVPRYRVWGFLMSMSVLEKEPRFLGLLELSNEKFLEKYVVKYGIDVEGLQMVSLSSLNGKNKGAEF